MKFRLFPALVAFLAVALVAPVRGVDAPKPLRVLLVTGGCCHDYARQKDILKEGIEKRANAHVDIIYTTDYELGATGEPDPAQPKLPIYGHAGYAKGYDVVIHDECASNISNEETVKAVLAPHIAGIPGVNLHCAMHSYRIGDPNDPVTDIAAPHAYWYEYVGLQSSRYDAQEPIAVHYLDPDSPITKGMSDWTTLKEEHFNNVLVLPTAHLLAKGTQTVHPKKELPDGTTESLPDRTDAWVDVWTNLYKGKTRVFSTTIGHNNETVADPRYLDLVTRGLLWVTGHLNNNGTPAKGYGPGGK